MSTYKHGVYVREVDTALVAPIEASAGLPVVIGTAPVNTLANPAAAVNKPLLVHNYKEAVEAIGWSDDFASYTLCEAVSAAFSVIGVGPLVLINVLDPANSAHVAAVAEATITVKDHVALVETKGMLDDSNLVVKDDGTALTKNTDYTVSYDDKGNLAVTLLSASTHYSAASLKIAGKKLDPSAVTAADIVGGVNISTGAETGLEVIRQVYPLFGLVPGILLAPRYSMQATVAAALQAKTKAINGVFSCVAYIDVNSASGGAEKYSDVNTAKQAQGISDPNAYALWPFCKVGDAIYSGSTIAAMLTAFTDGQNDDIPNVSPSNKTLPITGICLADGVTDIILDQDQANTVNSFGVATFLNMNGFRLWGSNSAAYPGNTDPKDRWINVRRFFCWTGNSFILTYFQKVDDPANPRLIETIVDSENVRGNSFVDAGACARYEITYNPDENTTTDLLNGTLTFHQYLAPYTPAECIENVLEFDPDALAAALG